MATKSFARAALSLAFFSAFLLPMLALAQANAPGSPYTNGSCFDQSDCNAAGGYTCDLSINTCVSTNSIAGQQQQQNSLSGTNNGSTGGTGGSGINVTYLNNYKTGILYVINSILVPVLISIAFIVFLWGVAQSYIISGASDDARERGHTLILWGIIGFVVIFSVWGLVNIVGATLGLSAGGTAAGNGLTPPAL
jgi:hypothetical protein